MKKFGLLLMAIFIASIFVFAQQNGKSLTITGIPSKYGIYSVELSNNEDFNSSIHVGLDTVSGWNDGSTSFSNGTLTGVLASTIFGVYFDGRSFSGPYFVILMLIDETDYAFEIYVSRNRVNFSAAMTEIPFSDFNFIERRQGQ